MNQNFGSFKKKKKKSNCIEWFPEDTITWKKPSAQEYI